MAERIPPSEFKDGGTVVDGKRYQQIRNNDVGTENERSITLPELKELLIARYPNSLPRTNGAFLKDDAVLAAHKFLLEKFNNRETITDNDMKTVRNKLGIAGNMVSADQPGAAEVVLKMTPRQAFDAIKSVVRE